MSFKTELVVKRIMNNDDEWEIVEPLVYDDSKYHIEVIKGFICDFASIPQFMWNILPANGQETDRASVLHDYLYRFGIYPRDVCDRLFLEAMNSDGTSYIKRYAMYRAVRMFGGSSYKGKK